MKKIKLPCYNIEVSLEDGCGTISSDLEDYVPFHAIESIVLAHACAGIDIESSAYIEGIETAIDVICHMD